MTSYSLKGKREGRNLIEIQYPLGRGIVCYDGTENFGKEYEVVVSIVSNDFLFRISSKDIEKFNEELHALYKKYAIQED